MSRIHRPSLLAGVCAAALLLAHTANAGPPLICQPFVTGDAPLLPWTEGLRNWDARDPGYDVAHLTADTLELLSAGAPIIARMENLRRATIYASHRPRVATELMGAVLERTRAAAPESHAAALAWFDAGYLIETYRQMGTIDGADLLATFAQQEGLLPGGDGVDGYALIQKAVRLAPEITAEAEFAASLMMTEARGAARHREQAAAGAAPGSLLALNLAR